MSQGKRRAEKKTRAARDGTRFVALPLVVLDSAAYMSLSHTAKALLIDIARQFNGDNNGQLVACDKYLKPRGWKSHDTITRALRELQEARLLFCTRVGKRPNTAAWFAVTWQGLNWNPKMEVTAESYQRGAYTQKNTPVIPADGVAGKQIAPSGGGTAHFSTPAHGAIESKTRAPPTPSCGDYLELPSVPSKAHGLHAAQHQPTIRPA